MLQRTANRIKLQAGQIWHKATHNPVVEWVGNDIKKAEFIHAIIILSVFGWIPYAWFILVPLVGVYALLKRDQLIQYLNQTAKNIDKFIDNIGIGISKFFLNRWKAIAKASFAFLLFVDWPMPFSFFMVYALYRRGSDENRIHILFSKMYDFSRFGLELMKGFIDGLPGIYKAVFIGVGMLFAVLFAKLILPVYALLPILDFALTLTGLALIVIGSTLLFRDVFYALTHPFQTFTNRLAPILGAAVGNNLAHKIFVGKVSGSMGPTVGSVYSTGFFSSLAGLFIPNAGGTYSRFLFNSSYGGLFAQRTLGGLSAILGNLFFSYDVSSYGTFTGVLGPTSLQIFFFMILGAAFGYAIDRLVHHLYSFGKSNLSQATDKATNVASNKFKLGSAHFGTFLYNWRWPIGMAIGATAFAPPALFLPFQAAIAAYTASHIVTHLALFSTLLVPSAILFALGLATFRYFKPDSTSISASLDVVDGANHVNAYERTLDDVVAPVLYPRQQPIVPMLKWKQEDKIDSYTNVNNTLIVSDENQNSVEREHRTMDLTV